MEDSVSRRVKRPPPLVLKGTRPTDTRGAAAMDEYVKSVPVTHVRRVRRRAPPNGTVPSPGGKTKSRGKNTP